VSESSAQIQADTEDTSEKPEFLRSMTGEHQGPQLVTFLSVKGGIGVSMIIANLAVYLAQTGKRVLLVDARRWGRNLHTFLGISSPEHSLDSLFNKEVDDFEDLIVDTPYPNLKLLSGMKESVAATTAKECPFLIEQCRKLSFDMVFFDMPPQISFNLFDHALWSDMSVLVGAPEPTAIERLYELLRGLYFRLFKTLEEKTGIQDIVEKAMVNSLELGINTPKDLVSAIHFFKPEAGDKLASEIKRFHINLMLNQVRSSNESDVGRGIISVTKRYFGLEMTDLGFLENDSIVPASIRQRKPLHIIQKDANITKQIEQVARSIMSRDYNKKSRMRSRDDGLES